MNKQQEDNGFLLFVVVATCSFLIVEIAKWLYKNYKTRVKVGVVYRCKKQWVGSTHLTNQTIHYGQHCLLLKREITRQISLYSEYTLLLLDTGLTTKVRFYGRNNIFFRDVFEKID